MRTAQRVERTRDAGTRKTKPQVAARSDLTARARIRDAAIECFAREGFGATVRTIAAAAGVSPALITHHFGSKDALQEVCDAEVLRRIREMKTATVSGRSGQMFSALSDLEAHAPMLLYMLRSLQAGGEVGRRFRDHMMDDARVYMAQGVANGLVKPSRDEEARLRYLTDQTLGAILLEFLLTPPEQVADFATFMTRMQRTNFLPTLELLTEGLLADSTMFEDYLRWTEHGADGNGADGHEAGGAAVDGPSGDDSAASGPDSDHDPPRRPAAPEDVAPDPPATQNPTDALGPPGDAPGPASTRAPLA